MTFTLPRAPRRAATAAVAGLALLPLVGCGGDEAAGGSSGESLARLAPASAPLYVEAVIRPEGEQKSDLDALIGKVAPGQSLDKLVGQAFKGGTGGLDFEKDVKPWLGERAGIAVTGVTPAGDVPEAAAILETTDGDKALAALRKSKSGSIEDREYGGVRYLFDKEDEAAAGLVDETVVIGTEAGLKAVVDTSKGKGLDTNADYEKVVDAVDDDALGFVYGDVRKGLELVQGASAGDVDAKQLEGIRELLDRQGVKTIAAALEVGDDSIRLRAASAVKDNGQGGAAAETLAGLPAGSWAAAGLGDIGKSLSDALDSLKGVAAPGFDVTEGLEQLEQQAGIDVQKDLISWMGQGGLFVRGTSLTDIGGALVVQSKDPAATKAALAKARTLVAGGGLPAKDLSGPGIDDGFSVSPGPDAPIEVFAALAGERFVLAVNRAALDEAIKPSKKLEEDTAFKAAADELGDDMKPSFFLDFPKVNGLLGLAAGGQPGFARVKPYLDRLGTIAAGGKREGDLQLQSFVVGVK